MQQLRLLRYSVNESHCLGHLATYPDPDGLALWTIERGMNDNKIGKSCILYGSYVVIPHISPRFGRCRLVTGTEPRTHILFHAANWAKQLSGCIAPGLRAGLLKDEPAVLNSRTACRKLEEWAGDEPFRLIIRPA